MNRIFCRLKFLVYSITSVTIYYMYFYVQVMFYIFILSISLFILVIILIVCLVLFCFVLSHFIIHCCSSHRHAGVERGRGVCLVGGAFELLVIAVFSECAILAPERDASCDWAPDAAIGANQRCIARRRRR